MIEPQGFGSRSHALLQIGRQLGVRRTFYVSSGCSLLKIVKLVLQGVPFRDAYKQIGQDIEQGRFIYTPSPVHTHEGSIGNLQTAEINGMMGAVFSDFNFDRVNSALERLLQ